MLSLIISGVFTAACGWSCYQCYLEDRTGWMYGMAALTVWNGLIFVQGLTALL